MKIGIFDSGIGGLTILNSLMDRFPDNNYLYFGDTRNLPYGDKTEKELKPLVDDIIHFLIEKDVDLIVIACGTVSSTLSDYLKSTYSIRIIDIISPVIDYLRSGKFKKIGILATSVTISSHIFSKNLANKDIKEVACPAFVPLIESGKLEKIDDVIDSYCHDLKDRDLIVLGCTHYPLIKDRLENYFGNSPKILNMADILELTPDNSSKNPTHTADLYFSHINDTIRKNINSVMTHPYKILVF